MRTREILINAALDEMACNGLFLCELKPEGYLPTDLTTNELHAAVKSLAFGHHPYWHDEVHALLVFLEALRMRHGIVVCECTGTDYELIHPSHDRFACYCKLCEHRESGVGGRESGAGGQAEPTYQSVAESRGVAVEEELQAVSLAKSVTPKARPRVIIGFGPDPVPPVENPVPTKTFREHMQNLLATICRALGLPRHLVRE